MATMTVKNATGGTETIEKPLAPARALAAASRPVVLSTEDLAAINAITAAITTLDGRVDGLETLVGATNTALATLVSQTDTLETLIAATNAALSTIDGRVDGLETLITATNAALAAAIPAGTNVIGKVGLDQTTSAFKSSATFTPAATSHVANDVVGGAQEFTAVGNSATSILITGAELEIDGATAEATAWRLHLYSVTPPSATADDGAWDIPSGDRASYLGYIDLGTAVDQGSTQWIETQGINKQVKLAGTSLFGYLINLTTLTPAAVAHKVNLYTLAV